jgi:hypothetical protein
MEIHRLVQQVEPTREQLTVQMVELKTRLDACSSFVSAHLALLTPIRRMPSDSVINIFLLLCHRYGRRTWGSHWKHHCF